MYGQVIDISQTLQAVCNAVSVAEATFRTCIKQYHPDASEEFITNLLHDHIKYELREASKKNLIRDAFLEDLKSALPNHAISDWNLDRELHWKAEGLIADIVLHNKRQEGKTGGDFGFVVVHPQISASYDSLALLIEKGRVSGLLCQAKLKGKNQKWRLLGKNQKAILPDYLDFTSLVLYSYFDKERTELNPVVWKLCKGKTISEIDELLKKGDFGELLKISEIITRLGKGSIGTKDQTLIDTVISPSSRQYFEIRIYWPKDNNPKETTSVNIRQQHTAQESVFVRH
jgi:hypothetical protein